MTHPLKLLKKIKHAVKFKTYNKKAFFSDQHFILNKNNKKRIRMDYTKNYTPAIALPLSNDQLERMKDNQQALLTTSKDLIKEHAARRVDMYFYLLVDYYQANKTLMRGRTFLQHGVGRDTSTGNLTQACHSSFFGAMMENKEKASRLSKTAFEDNLNATIELPAFVNKFDDELEEQFGGRAKASAILQRVSFGELTPEQGLRAFLLMMKSLFDTAKNTTPYPHAFSLSKELRMQLIQLQREGTLINKLDEKKNVVNEDYIMMLLRLTPEEKALCKDDEKMKQMIFESKMKQVREEITVSPSLRYSRKI